tara:strand:+ start:152 stop:403 length:252 start_codon:yes stop_codon:yes gene_type:complete
MTTDKIFAAPFDIEPLTLNFFDLDNLIEKYSITVEEQTPFAKSDVGAFFAVGKPNDVVAFLLAITEGRDADRILYLAHIHKRD